MSLVPRVVEMYQCDKGHPLKVEGSECRRVGMLSLLKSGLAAPKGVIS